MSLIELVGVTKAFYANREKDEAVIALDQVDLSIEKGEFVSLIGPSGCGKTVALSMMAGFSAPTLGEVRCCGAPIAGPGPDRGVVFQEYSLLPWLTVEDNIVFAVKNSCRARRERFDKRDAHRRAAEALCAVGLPDAGALRPNTLSGGMKQRVAIARLLAMDSEVFLMDEPFSALDEQTRSILDRSLFDLWRERGKTIVFVTHNITEAVLVSSRIVLFSGPPGRVAGQWVLSKDLERDLDSPEIRRVSEQIREALAAGSSAFGAQEAQDA